MAKVVQLCGLNSSVFRTDQFKTWILCVLWNFAIVLVFSKVSLSVYLKNDVTTDSQVAVKFQWLNTLTGGLWTMNTWNTASSQQISGYYLVALLHTLCLLDWKCSLPPLNLWTQFSWSEHKQLFGGTPSFWSSHCVRPLPNVYGSYLAQGRTQFSWLHWWLLFSYWLMPTGFLWMFQFLIFIKQACFIMS